MSVVRIQTSEGVSFTLPLAGPASRFLAWLIDQLLVVAAVAFSARGLQALWFLSPDLRAALTVFAYFVIWIGYGILLEWWWSGQTVGKRVLHLKVADATGGKIEFSQIALRNLLRFLDALPVFYLTGGIAMLCNSKNQRLGDVVANTIVLRPELSELPDFAAVNTAEKYNSFLEIPHLAARLRQVTPPELAVLAYEALLRRDQLDANARSQLFAELAAEFKKLVRFPEHVVAAFSDERYVRTAIGALSAKNRAMAERPSKAAMTAF
jgi:uncharacterized RDD family membrane protein YckC